MADEAEVIEQSQDVTDVEVKDEKPTADKQDNKTGKTFSQADIDKAVQTRVRREQTSFKTERESWATEKETLVTQATEYEDVIKEFIEEKSKDFAPALKALFDKLSVKEQWEYLKNPEFVTQGSQKTKIPKTPSADGEQTPVYRRSQRI